MKTRVRIVRNGPFFYPQYWGWLGWTNYRERYHSTLPITMVHPSWWSTFAFKHDVCFSQEQFARDALPRLEAARNPNDDIEYEIISCPSTSQ
jgi:hypothetical protein